MRLFTIDPLRLVLTIEPLRLVLTIESLRLFSIDPLRLLKDPVLPDDHMEIRRIEALRLLLRTNQFEPRRVSLLLWVRADHMEPWRETPRLL